MRPSGPALLLATGLLILMAGVSLSEKAKASSVFSSAGACLVAQVPERPPSASDAAPAAPVATDDAMAWRDYQDPEDEPDARPWWQTLASFLGRLLVVLGLAVATLLGLRRFMALRAPLGDGRIQVLEQTRLVGTQSLCLVQAGTRILLLGTNGTGLMVLLAEWPADQAPPTVAEAMFRKEMGRAGRPGEGPNVG